MNSPTVTEAFEAMEQLDLKLVVDKTFDETDFQQLLTFLHHPDLHVFTRASLMIPDLTQDQLNVIIELFHSTTTARQHILVTQLTSTDYHYTYNTLFDVLEMVIATEQRDKYPLCDMIVVCLSKCEYPIIALLFRKLGTAKGAYLDQLKRIMLKRGFFYFRPFLSALPELPFEKVFRDVFGNALIDRFKADL